MKIQQLSSVVLFIILAAWSLPACSSIMPQPTPESEPAVVEDFPAVVSATGIVTPAQWARLSMTTAGIVEEVLVQEGDVVQAGAPLVRLKGQEDLQAAVSAANMEITAAQKALDDLNKNAETSKTQTQDLIALYAQQVRDAQYQLDNFTVPTNQVNLDPLEGLDLMTMLLDQARAAFEPYRVKPSSDPVRKDLKERLDRAQSDTNAAVKRLEYVTRVAVASDNLARARQDLAIWEKGPQPGDVAVAQARLDNAKAVLASAQAKLRDLELLAPFAGTVSEVSIRAGEWVNPGISIVQIADLEHLHIETTDLNEIDAARVNLGDEVNITFDALPDVTVAGIVKKISPKAAAGSGVNYTARIELTQQPGELRWGMTAFVDIVVEP